MESAGTPAGAVRLEFTGRAGEYFRIWIVNVLLTVITLGIYSAWAKVRRNRYLYSSVRLSRASFDYLAEPVQILKGRLIAIALLAVYVGAGRLSEPVQGALGIAFAIALPWLVTRARKFTLRNTAYRNIRFDFAANYGQAAAVFLFWPLMIALTLGLLYPFYVGQRAKFMIANSAFGAHAFSFKADTSGFFAIYGKFLLLVIAVLVTGGIAAGAAFSVNADALFALPGAAIIATLLALLATLSYVHAAVTNRIWSNVEIGGMSTRSELKVWPMYWIALSGMAGVVLTFGLLIPWATIRMLRYRIENLTVLNTGELDAFVGAQSTQVGSAGEELSDLLGVDIAV